jgi:tetratricopeptide (TPR) repeat protein
MQRCAILFFSLSLVIGCGQKQDQPIQAQPQTIVVVMQQPPKGDLEHKVDPKGPDLNLPVDPKVDPLPTGLTAQERYDQAVARAFKLLSERKEGEALATFQQAQAVQNTDFVKGEIERLKARIARGATIERTVHDIKTVLTSGRPVEAAKLASDALEQFGDSDVADDLTQLKRQADALLTTQLEDNARKQRFIDEAETARKALNYRAALVAYDQAVANRADVTDYRDYYEKLRNRIGVYDQQRARAAELRRDAYKLDEAIAALEEARKAWETPQILKEIDEAKFAVQNRRDRLAVAEFEVVGDVGIPLAGRALADDLLPHFKARFDLVERGQIAAIVEELKLNPDEIHINEKGRSEIGRIARARFLVVGSVSRLYGLTVIARLVDVQTGLIVQTGKIVAGNPQELSARMKTLAAMLMMSDEQKILHERPGRDHRSAARRRDPAGARPARARCGCRAHRRLHAAPARNWRHRDR